MNWEIIGKTTIAVLGILFVIFVLIGIVSFWMSVADWKDFMEYKLREIQKELDRIKAVREDEEKKSEGREE